jgi:hypothetical protein
LLLLLLGNLIRFPLERFIHEKELLQCVFELGN